MCYVKKHWNVSKNEGIGIADATFSHGLSRTTCLLSVNLISNLSGFRLSWLIDCLDSACVIGSQGSQSSSRENFKICKIKCYLQHGVLWHNCTYAVVIQERLLLLGENGKSLWRSNIWKWWGLKEGCDVVNSEGFSFMRRESNEYRQGERKVCDDINWYFCSV